MICWTDSLEIAISLSDNFPDIDPKTINFVDLRELVLNLDDFEEGQSKCGERVLEAIQMNWIEETE
ncbi:MAG: Fe-S cluster assembly protein IscX [Thiotrichales bacterium]|jgi:FeS assembly protein IscX|nr:Fe-S cluster assembly protein IscX [Thiotrichales bacterium]MBT3854309.1 Fe-S cluster assembly protein IscX [Thiotrichales bacterium]MBT4653311.1 Fe-S cluster assembly protein IscX [Thiotrichales bacterium]MBT5499424.1 Fe-S cluster assembly protein IscX [Thiotrichales bacterium]MBT5983658.1 Fe-S cluster assembly protein IscX [Thiotrichales bacterium]